MNIFSDAKLRRFDADSKKLRQIFFNLFGQTSELWTKRGNWPPKLSTEVFFLLRKACEDLEVWEKFANFADGYK